jgi:hypothetical protein
MKEQEEVVKTSNFDRILNKFREGFPNEYKNEIVLKLLKVTSSSQELEELLGEEVMNKIKYLVL